MDVTTISTFVVKREVSSVDGSITFTFYNQNETTVLDTIKLLPTQIPAFFSALDQIAKDLTNVFDETPLEKYVVHDINGLKTTVEFR